MRNENTSLVRQMKDGDVDAFVKLCEIKRQSLYQIAFCICGNKWDAEEAVQDTFVEVYRNIHDLHSTEKINSWMVQILKRKCFRIIRRRRDEPSLDMLIEKRDSSIPYISGHSPEEHMEAGERRRSLLAAIASLSPRAREAINHFYYDEMSVKEIADLTGTNINTVTSNLSRGRAALKAILLREQDAEMAGERAGSAAYGAIVAVENGKAFSNAGLSKLQASWAQLLTHINMAWKGAAMGTKAIAVAAAAVTVAGCITVSPLAVPDAEGAVVFSGGASVDGHLNPASASLTLKGAYAQDVSWNLTDTVTGEVVLSGAGAPADLTMAKELGLNGRYRFNWHAVDPRGFNIDVERELVFS